MQNEQHLGDGAYVTFDGYSFELWCERHADGGGMDRHQVFLEPPAMRALIEFVKAKGMQP